MVQGLSDPDEFDPNVVKMKVKTSESFEKAANNITQKQKSKEEKKADGELDKKTFKENMVKTKEGWVSYVYALQGWITIKPCCNTSQIT